LNLSGIQFKMRQRIVNKLEKAGATSIQTAVTTEEAKFDLLEQQWLGYFAGGFLSEVKKTQDRRYYV
jgi:hypothetical protein